MPTRVIEASGAQILPPADDQRATISAFTASQAANADHRRKYPVYAALASSLTVEVVA